MSIKYITSANRAGTTSETNDVTDAMVTKCQTTTYLMYVRVVVCLFVCPNVVCRTIIHRTPPTLTDTHGPTEMMDCIASQFLRQSYVCVWLMKLLWQHPYHWIIWQLVVVVVVVISIDWLIDRLIDWLIDWFIDLFMIDWLIDWQRFYTAHSSYMVKGKLSWVWESWVSANIG